MYPTDIAKYLLPQTQQLTIPGIEGNTFELPNIVSSES